MRRSSLSLLFTAIWLAPTAFALVARSPNHQARAEKTPEYPNSHDAKRCPLDSTTIDLHTIPTGSEAVTQPAAGLSRVLMPSKAQPDLTPDSLSQVCRQVGRFEFQAQNYDGLSLGVATSIVPPGLYVVSAQADALIRGLHIDNLEGPLTVFVHVHDNQLDHVGGQFQIHAPVRLRIVLRLWWTDAAGEIGLFRLGPRGYVGTSS